MPFGVGNRICAGQNLAQIVLRATTAAIVSNFDVSANSRETNERTMEMREAFVSIDGFQIASAAMEANRDTGHAPRLEGLQAYIHPAKVLSSSLSRT